jgi:hypothetical protein
MLSSLSRLSQQQVLAIHLIGAFMYRLCFQTLPQSLRIWQEEAFAALREEGRVTILFDWPIGTQ